MHSLLIFCLVASAVAVPANPKTRRPSADAWTGKLVMLKNNDVSITQIDSKGEVEIVAQLGNMVYRVVEEHDSRLRVRQGSKDGWFDKSHAILIEDAPAFFSERIRANAEDSNAFAHRGTAYQVMNKLDLAIKDYDDAIRINPASSWFNNRGIIHGMLKNYDKAIADLTESINLNGDDPTPLINRSRVHTWKKDYEKAIADLEEAIRLDSDDPGPYLARGFLFDRQKRTGEALSDFERVNKLDPNNSSALNARAWLLATTPAPKLRDGKYAVELATKACELTKWKDANIIDTLAAACAEAGQYDDAVKYQTQALADPTFLEQAGERARQRLRLYMKKIPYREEEPDGE